MRRGLIMLAVAALVAAVCLAIAWAQDAEYTLKDYMPRTVGSKWTMKSSGRETEGTVVYEVMPERDVAGQKALPIVTKTSEGRILYGSAEMLTAEKLTILGSIFGRRGEQGGGQPIPILYEPAASFPGKMRVGQSAEAKFKINRGERQMDITMKLELAAVEPVTVPKGTFEGCLKLVYATSFGRGEMKRTEWYAKGVGIVKSERSAFRGGAGTTAELTDYALAK